MAYSFYRPSHRVCCGCWFPTQTGNQYLSQVELESHTTILATTSRTVLNQTFFNPAQHNLKEVSYTFPLYDGVSVAGFRCRVAGRSIVGVVKERNQARTEYQEAIDKGQTAGLLEQSLNAADVFTTSIGNVPAGEKVYVEITYLGELKNDAETDGARFTIPTNIAPRYGQGVYEVAKGPHAINKGGIKITVDVQLEHGVAIRGIQSPSHPIAITMGRTSKMAEDMNVFESNLASSTLTLGTTELDKDFIVVVQAKGQDTPRALLETHPTLPDQRVLMTTLVPKFNIPNEHPEIVFVVDRSGSMSGSMHLVSEALKVFLKSLPVSVKFNICSFGSRHSFLFDKSRTYDAESLQMAMNHISFGFTANYGGTEMLKPVQEVLKNRYKDLPLEVMLLTDGQIHNQQALFDEINAASEKNARFFTLGIGSGASSSLVEGIARAGRGFSQWVNDGERIDKRIVRMLKGALTPHIKYKLEVKYVQPDNLDEEDFEIIESFDKSMDLVGRNSSSTSEVQESPQKKKKISLFDSQSKDEPPNKNQGRYDHLPRIAIPNVLQTPHDIPELYPHSRSTVYLILGPNSNGQIPSSVTLRGTTEHNDLELEIPVQDIGQGQTLHQLAAKKAIQELEEGRGWLTEIKTTNGKSFKSAHEGKWNLIVEREAVRLGTMFQVGGKFCSFVAVQDGQDELPAYESAAAQSTEEEARRESITIQMSAGGSSFASYAPAAFRSASRGGLSSMSYYNSGPVQLQEAAPLMAQQQQQQQQMQQQMQPLAQRSMMFGQSAAPSERRSSPSAGGLFGFRARTAAPPAPPAPATAGFSSSPSYGASASSFGNAQSSLFSTPVALSADSAPGSAFGVAAKSSPSYDFPPPTINAMQSIGSRDASLSSRQAGKGEVSSSGEKKKKSSFSLRAARKGRSDASADDQVTGTLGFAPPAPTNAPARPAATQTLSPLETMQRLIDLQTFTGLWTITPEFSALVSYNAVQPAVFANEKALVRHVMDVREKDKMSVDGAEYSEEVCATIVAIAWLESVMEDEKDVWEMVVEKAKEWLEGWIDGSEEIEKIVEGVKKSWKK